MAAAASAVVVRTLLGAGVCWTAVQRGELLFSALAGVALPVDTSTLADNVACPTFTASRTITWDPIVGSMGRNEFFA